MPFGEFLVPKLQDITAVFVEYGIQYTGIPAYIDGYIIEIPEGTQVGAAIDVGATSLHLLVAAVGTHSVQPLLDESAFLGLGDRVAADGHIIEYQGAVRHVPTTHDYSATTAWEDSRVAKKGVYQTFIVRPDIQTYAYAQVGGGGALVGSSMDSWGALKKNDKEYQAFIDVMEKQRITQDRNARRELVYDMQKRMAKNVWNFYWPAPDSPVVSNKKVHNFRPPPGWNWNVMKYVWKDA